MTQTFEPSPLKFAIKVWDESIQEYRPWTAFTYDTRQQAERVARYALPKKETLVVPTTRLAFLAQVQDFEDAEVVL